MARTDQRISAVLGRREHHVVPAAQPPGGAPQIRRGQLRAIGADEDRAGVARQGMMHARAQVAAALQAKRKSQTVEKRMPARAMDLDASAARRESGAHRMPRQPLVQPRGAPFAERGDQARLRRARHRRFGENDDHRS
jgi:hypothetical protein